MRFWGIKALMNIIEVLGINETFEILSNFGETLEFAFSCGSFGFTELEHAL